MTKARKGDLALHRSESTVIEVCRVASATREGIVKALAPIRYDGDTIPFHPATQAVFVLERQRVLDWDGLVAAVRAHAWPNLRDDGPTPFASLVEARQAILPFVHLPTGPT